MARIAARLPRPLLAALALTALAHLPALRAGFVQDDLIIVAASPVVARGSLPEILSSSWWAGFPLDDRALWRPVTIGSFALERRLTNGPFPGFGHAVNLLIHLSACAALYALARRLKADPFAAAVAAALFGVLPVRSEAVFAVVGRADLLAGFFTLVAALAFRDRASKLAPWLAAACVALAIGSKETGLAALAVLVALDAIDGGPRRPLRAWIPILAFAGAAVIARTFALEAFFPTPNLPPMDNPIAHLPPGPRWGTALALVTRYAALVVAPVALSLDWSGPSVTPETGLVTARSVAGAAILLAWGLLAALPLAVRSPRTSLRVAAAGASLALFPYLVVANLLKPIGVAMAERLLYLPAAGIALAAGAGLAALGARKIATAIAVIAALAGAGRTFVRAFDWKDERTAFAAATRANPASPRAFYAVAKIDADALTDPASNPVAVAKILAGLDRAIALWDDYPVAWYAKGRLLARRGDLAAAEPILRGAVKRGQAYADAWVDLGLVLQRRGARDEAIRAFRKGVLFDPRQDKGWASLGHLALEAGDFARAAAYYQRAISLGRTDLAPRLEEARRGAASNPATVDVHGGAEIVDDRGGAGAVPVG